MFAVHNVQQIGVRVRVSVMFNVKFMLSVELNLNLW